MLVYRYIFTVILEVSFTGPDRLKNVIIFLSIGFNICFGCSKEPSH